MSDFKRKFYYGDGTDHIVELTQNQALAISEALISQVDAEDPTIVELTLPTGTSVEDYNEAADILNNYIDNASEPVFYNDTSKPIVRPVTSK